MAERIRRGYPLQLPPYKWSGEAASWAGKVLSALDPDLPAAYLRAHLESLGLTLHYVSPNAPGAGAPLRVPCVLFGGEAGLISSLSGEAKARADALGLVHASIPAPPRRGPEYASDMLVGTPTSYDEAEPAALDPPTYLGGRVLVLYGAFSGGEYLDTQEVSLYEFDAQPGDGATCELLSPTPGRFTAGTAPLPASASASGPFDFENNGPVGSRLADDKDFLLQAAPRFDRFQVWYQKTPPAGTVTYFDVVVCFDNFDGVDTLAQTSDEKELDASAYAAGFNAAGAQVVDQMGGYGRQIDGDPSAEQVLAYFEADD
jgi:hypothetical protein